jgi:O-antigen ligase
VQFPEAVVATPAVSPPKTTWVVRTSLIFAGLMLSLPFLNFHHSYPLPTFYAEWLAFALGGAALLALVAPASVVRLPYLSIGLIGLVIVLLVQVAMERVAYAERSLLGMLYVLWAALLVWLGSRLREQCGIERLALVAQVSLALGGLLVALAGFVMLYRIDLFGFRLISGPGMEGMMVGPIGQRNNFANYLGCALVSVVFLYGKRRAGLVLAALLSAPLILALVLSTSRAALLYVALAPIAAFWAFRQGDRARLRPLLAFSLVTLLLFLVANVAVALTSGPGAPVPTPGERWLESFAPGRGQYDIQTRLYFLRESWAMLASHPLLGAGFGEFAWNIFDHGADPHGRSWAMAVHAHNALFELLAETGLLGTLCVVLPLALWLRAFLWAAPGLEGAWIMTVLAIQALHSGLEFPLWHANFLGLAALLAGAAAQPGVTLAYNRFRRTALMAVLAGGALAIGVVLSDYRGFERWYVGADASQRKGLPLSEQQLSELASQRAVSLFAGYYDLLASELLIVDREHLDAKLELNGRVLRFIPIPGAALRQTALQCLSGDPAKAERTFARLAVMYPAELPGNLKRLEEMAREDPAAFAAFAAGARRRYGP